MVAWRRWSIDAGRQHGADRRRRPQRVCSRRSEIERTGGLRRPRNVENYHSVNCFALFPFCVLIICEIDRRADLLTLRGLPFGCGLAAHLPINWPPKFRRPFFGPGVWQTSNTLCMFDIMPSRFLFFGVIKRDID